MDIFTTEKWLPIDGFEGSYEVSDRGRVRSLDRISAQGRPIKGVVLPLASNNGYRQVGLTRDRKRSVHLVHRLVLATFVGPAPVAPRRDTRTGTLPTTR